MNAHQILLRDAYERAKIQPESAFIPGIPNFNASLHILYVVKLDNGEMIAGTGLAFSRNTADIIASTRKSGIVSHWIAGTV